MNITDTSTRYLGAEVTHVFKCGENTISITIRDNELAVHQVGTGDWFKFDPAELIIIGKQCKERERQCQEQIKRRDNGCRGGGDDR